MDDESGAVLDRYLTRHDAEVALSEHPMTTSVERREMKAEHTFKQFCHLCLRMRTTVHSRATDGGWRPFADWWMCSTCARQA